MRKCLLLLATAIGAVNFIADFAQLANGQGTFPGVVPPGTVLGNNTISTQQFPSALTALGLVSPSSAIVAATSTNGSYIASNTASVDWCPAWPSGCAGGTSGGLWTSQQFLVSTTVNNATAQESGLMSVVFATTGFFFIWAQSTGYVSGNIAEANGNLYTETVASCTSASTGSGPSGPGSGITDNTCSWNYSAPSSVGAKQSGNFNTVASSGGGQVWGITSHVFTASGWVSQFAAGAEIDAGNSSTVGTTFGVGPAQIYNLYLAGVNSHPITAALYISPQGSASPAPAQYGIILNGTTSFSSAAIFNNSTGATNFIADSGSTSIGINLAGTYTGGAAIQTNNSINISTAGNNANFNEFVTGQQWALVTNATSKNIALLDQTNSKTPFSIVPNSPTNAIEIIAGGPILGGAGTAIASLPTCNGANAGVRLWVTNGVATPTFGATVSTTGAVASPVFCNGSNWTYG